MTDSKIVFTEQKISPDGTVLESKGLTVQGETLKECRKHFDEVWKQ